MPEIYQSEHRRFWRTENDDVARMRVRVEKAVLEDHLDDYANGCFCDFWPGKAAL